MSDFELIPHAFSSNNDAIETPFNEAVLADDASLDGYDLARIAQQQPLLSEAQEQAICQRMQQAASNLLLTLCEGPKLLGLLEDFIEHTEQEMDRFHHLKDKHLKNQHMQDKVSRDSSDSLTLYRLIDELRLMYYLRQQGHKDIEQDLRERRRRLKRYLADWLPPAYMVIRFIQSCDLDTLPVNHRERLQELLKNYHQQRNRMAQANLRLVYSVANKFRYLGLSYEDLVQEGSLGLIKAIERFDFNKGFRFSTYAYRVISQGIHLAIDKNSALVRKPYKLLRDKAVVDQTRIKLEQRLGKTPSARELADALPENIQHKRAHTDNHANITADTHTLYTSPHDPSDHAALGEAEQIWQTGGEHTRTLLEQLVKRLPARDQVILRMRFGLGVPRQYTLEEISQRLSLSRERVRQIANNGVQTLKDALHTDT